MNQNRLQFQVKKSCQFCIHQTQFYLLLKDFVIFDEKYDFTSFVFFTENVVVYENTSPLNKNLLQLRSSDPSVQSKLPLQTFEREIHCPLAHVASFDPQVGLVWGSAGGISSRSIKIIMQAEIISLLANNMFIFSPLPHQKLCQSACTTTIANNWIITQTRPWSKKNTHTTIFFSIFLQSRLHCTTVLSRDFLIMMIFMLTYLKPLLNIQKLKIQIDQDNQLLGKCRFHHG